MTTITLPTKEALEKVGEDVDRIRSIKVGNTPWWIRWVKIFTKDRKMSELSEKIAELTDSLNFRVGTWVPYLWNAFNTEGAEDRYGAMAAVVDTVQEFPTGIGRLYGDVLDHITSFRGDYADEINAYVDTFAKGVGSDIKAGKPVAEVTAGIEALERLVEHGMMADEAKKDRLLHMFCLIKENYAPGVPLDELMIDYEAIRYAQDRDFDPEDEIKFAESQGGNN